MHRRDFLQATAAATGAAALNMPSSLLAAPSDKPLPIQFIDPDPATGSSKAVVVGPGVAVAQTTQSIWDADTSDLKAQVQKALESVEFDAKRVGSGLWHHAIKLHVALRNEADAPAVRELIAAKFPVGIKPAVTYVVGRLPSPNQLVAIDAIVLCADPFDKLRRPFHGEALNIVDVLPVGPRVYVSGQAEKGADLRTATRLTLDSLHKTLEWLSLDWKSVVQVKSFLSPMPFGDEHDAIWKFFEDIKVIPPPMSFVEWKSALPIEIELVASAAGMKPPSEAVGPVEFLTPPGMTASPVYSRVARVWSDRTIYTSGLYGREGQNSEGQIRDIFAQLEDVLKKCGSDFKHMAKATYYVSSDEASAKLNAIRPEFYDPQRPPAASKAVVAGVGMPGRSITLDMIAVPKA